MTDIDKMNVQIVTLGPMRVASIYAFGTDPRKDAFEKLLDWSGPRGFLNRKNEHPIFGFNNPALSSKGPKYGYELWIKVGEEIEPTQDIRILDFKGGPYAVTRYETNGETIKNTSVAWQKLTDWCKKNNYRLGYHQELEKFIRIGAKSNDYILDLHCPIVY
jgi:effector-binding domain-containing protein